MSHRVFISHTRDTKEIASKISGALDAAGIPVWTEKEIDIGDDFAEALERAWEGSDIFVLLASPDSVQMPYWLTELGYALGRSLDSPEVGLVPVLMPGASWQDIPRKVRERQAIDARDLDDDQIAAKVRDAVIDWRTHHAPAPEAVALSE